MSCKKDGVDPSLPAVPPVPAELYACANAAPVSLPAIPKNQSLSRKQAARLVADLKQSEAGYCLCAQRIIGWLDCYRQALPGKMCSVPTEQDVAQLCRSEGATK